MTRTHLERRLELLRDQERADADALAAVLTEQNPIVDRMRGRVVALGECARDARSVGPSVEVAEAWARGAAIAATGRPG